jgi:hypothetical protein
MLLPWLIARTSRMTLLLDAMLLRICALFLRFRAMLALREGVGSVLIGTDGWGVGILKAVSNSVAVVA